MSEDRADYLVSASGPKPVDAERLDLLRDVLSREATWAEAPPDVADRLFASIRSGNPTATPTPTREPSRRLAPVAALVGVAAIVLLVFGMTDVFSSADSQVVEVEGTDLHPEASGHAAIRETESGWWIQLDISNLPPAAEGTYYEGWVWNDAGDGVSIGTFHLRGGDESVALWSGVDPTSYPAIWVTLEDEDGDPSASDRIVMRGRP